MSSESSHDLTPPAAGTLFVLSAPSGAGKTTIIRSLFADADLKDSLYYSISHTNRPRRRGERDGHDYHFVDETTFRRMIDDGAFYEWADVHGQLKGTSKGPILERLAAGTDVLLDIDVQGAGQVRSQHQGAVSIFIMPPSFAELRRRLERRGLDAEGQIARRLEDARRELRQVESYDYVIVNDRVELAARRLGAIIRATRQRRARQQPIIDRMLKALPASPGAAAD